MSGSKRRAQRLSEITEVQQKSVASCYVLAAWIAAGGYDHDSATGAWLDHSDRCPACQAWVGAQIDRDEIECLTMDDGARA